MTKLNKPEQTYKFIRLVIAEVIIYDRKLIQEEIDAVETHLKNKWGL